MLVTLCMILTQSVPAGFAAVTLESHDIFDMQAVSIDEVQIEKEPVPQLEDSLHFDDNPLSPPTPEKPTLRVNDGKEMTSKREVEIRLDGDPGMLGKIKKIRIAINRLDEESFGAKMDLNEGHSAQIRIPSHEGDNWINIKTYGHDESGNEEYLGMIYRKVVYDPANQTDETAIRNVVELNLNSLIRRERDLNLMEEFSEIEPGAHYIRYAFNHLDESYAGDFMDYSEDAILRMSNYQGDQWANVWYYDQFKRKIGFRYRKFIYNPLNVEMTVNGGEPVTHDREVTVAFSSPTHDLTAEVAYVRFGINRRGIGQANDFRPFEETMTVRLADLEGQKQWINAWLYDANKRLVGYRYGSVTYEAPPVEPEWPSMIEINGKRVFVQMEELVRQIQEAMLEDGICIEGCSTWFYLSRLKGIMDVFTMEELMEFEHRNPIKGGLRPFVAEALMWDEPVETQDNLAVLRLFPPLFSFSIYTQKGWIDFVTELARRYDERGLDIYRILEAISAIDLGHHLEVPEQSMESMDINRVTLFLGHILSNPKMMRLIREGIASPEPQEIKAMKALIIDDLRRTFGLVEKVVLKALVSGEIQIEINRDALTGTVKLGEHFRHPSLKLSELFMPDPLGNQELPEVIEYHLGRGPAIGAPCVLNSDGSTDCPPSTFQLESAQYRMGNFSYHLNYLEGGFDTEGPAPLFGDNRLKSVEIFNENPDFVCITTPCHERVKRIQYDYLRAVDPPVLLQAVMTYQGETKDGIYTRFVQLGGKEDGRIHITAIDELDQDSRHVRRNEFEYANIAVLALCLGDQPCEPPAPRVSLAKIIRTDTEGNRISIIDSMTPSSLTGDISNGAARITREDGKQMEIHFLTMEDLMRLALRFEQSPPEPQVIAEYQIHEPAMKVILKDDGTYTVNGLSPGDDGYILWTDTIQDGPAKVQFRFKENGSIHRMKVVNLSWQGPGSYKIAEFEEDFSGRLRIVKIESYDPEGVHVRTGILDYEEGSLRSEATGKIGYTSNAIIISYQAGLAAFKFRMYGAGLDLVVQDQFIHTCWDGVCGELKVLHVQDRIHYHMLRINELDIAGVDWTGVERTTQSLQEKLADDKLIRTEKREVLTLDDGTRIEYEGLQWDPDSLRFKIYYPVTTLDLQDVAVVSGAETITVSNSSTQVESFVYKETTTTDEGMVLLAFQSANGEPLIFRVEVDLMGSISLHRLFD